MTLSALNKQLSLCGPNPAPFSVAAQILRIRTISNAQGAPLGGMAAAIGACTGSTRPAIALHLEPVERV